MSVKLNSIFKQPHINNIYLQSYLIEFITTGYAFAIFPRWKIYINIGKWIAFSMQSKYICAIEHSGEKHGENKRKTPSDAKSNLEVGHYLLYLIGLMLTFLGSFNEDQLAEQAKSYISMYLRHPNDEVVYVPYKDGNNGSKKVIKFVKVNDQWVYADNSQHA